MSFACICLFGTLRNVRKNDILIWGDIMAYKEKTNAIRYNNDFNKKAYDRINLTVPKGRKAEIQAAAEASGQSVNGFINELIDEALARQRPQGDSSHISSPERGEDTP